MEISALEQAGNGNWRPVAPVRDGRSYRSCLNGIQHQCCNWLVGADDPTEYCISCRLNDLIPDLSVTGNADRWRRLESTKRWVIYSILSLRLPLESRPDQPSLRFRFLADPVGGPPVMTGHNQGVITIDITEADDGEREHRRVHMHEPYRTLVGHLRHELAHYYWDRLIANSPHLAGWRELFGDETRDYAGALSSYYEHDAPADWEQRHVSAYAMSHPWEDWAESWAHYLHMVDSVETAGAFGLILRPPQSGDPATDSRRANGPDTRFDQILKSWLPMTVVLNVLNRGMGLPDLYPFVLHDPVIQKLRFVHEVIRASRTNGSQKNDILATDDPHLMPT